MGFDGFCDCGLFCVLNMFGGNREKKFKNNRDTRY